MLLMECCLCQVDDILQEVCALPQEDEQQEGGVPCPRVIYGQHHKKAGDMVKGEAVTNYKRCLSAYQNCVSSQLTCSHLIKLGSSRHG